LVFVQGSGASLYQQQHQPSHLAGNTRSTGSLAQTGSGKRPIDNRKLSYELRSNELDLINKLRREAAERSNEMMAEMLADGGADTESIDDVAERVLRKRSGYLSRLDEDSAMNDALLSPNRHLTRRSISRELFGGASGGADLEQRSLMSPTSSVGGSRPVTRRSISRELFDYTPSPGIAGGRITPTYGLVGASPARRSNVEFSRNSRERSLGRDTSTDFADRASARSVGGSSSSRRSESLTRGGAASQASSLLTPTSRPTLSTQGRSLTQNEFVRTSPRSSVSGRLAAGLDDDSRIRLSDRGSTGYNSGSTGYTSGSTGYTSGSTGYTSGSTGYTSGSTSYTGGSTGYNSGSTGYTSGSTGLNDRGRTDWRRVSVPERGKDYSSLQSKYKRWVTFLFK
jgi:hypothetical protein